MEQKKQGENEVVDYYQDIQNDTVSAVSWSISPTGPTLGTAYLPNTSGRVYKRLSGPFAESSYELRAKITGATGQVREVTCRIVITPGSH